MGTLALMGAVALGIAACGDGSTAPQAEALLLSVSPEGGAAAVAVDAPVVVTFDHAMHEHTADHAAVHEGGVGGPVVAGSWMMEEGGTVLRFTPGQPWKPGTGYTVHLGGGMRDAEGHMVDFESHGMGMGGVWADAPMMGGGMMGGQHPHMGEGWQHRNGSYGMVFSFTTAGTAGANAAVVAGSRDSNGGLT